MTRGLHRLPLEKPIYEIEDRIAELESAPLGAQQQEELRRLKREGVEIQKKIFGNLGPWQTVEVARHPDRPKTSDYLSLVFEEFVELHGDKAFGDDPAMLTGFAKLDRHKVLVVGHQKGKTLAERQACHFGCAHPEGYRKSMGKMRMAAKYGLPVICLIDTPGAYPGIGAEERGQAQVIAESMFLMATLPVPNDPAVRLVEVPGETMAVLRFTGDRGAEAVAARQAELLRGLAGTAWVPRGAPVAWFYDPPWTLPWLRRNEVAVPVAGG